MSGNRRAPYRAGFDFDYWLNRCAGFRVDAPEGRVGVVEWVWYSSRQDRPDALAIRCGLFRRRLIIVPVEEVAEIDPEEERVLLRSSPRPSRLRLRRGRQPTSLPGEGAGAPGRGCPERTELP